MDDGASGPPEVTGDPDAFVHELLRAEADLVETVAQLFWIAAPHRSLARGRTDEAGLVPILTDAPLTDRERDTFANGLDALLREADARARGVYLRDVRDGRGSRRELGVPVPPEAWRGAITMVGPFPDAHSADAWRTRAIAPPLVGDTITHETRVYVDVFSGEGHDHVARAVVDTSDDPG